MSVAMIWICVLRSDMDGQVKYGKQLAKSRIALNKNGTVHSCSSIDNDLVELVYTTGSRCTVMIINLRTPLKIIMC